MIIAFFSNYFNHHQKPIADAFNAIDGVDYYFVATTPMPEFRKQLGYKDLSADYVIDTTTSEKNKLRAMELSKSAEVAIYNASGLEDYIIPRLKLKKLTFEVSERRFKRGIINLFSPRLFKHQMMYYRFGRKAPLYLLCCSAYAARDYNLLETFVGRCYKWAYFTKVDQNFQAENIAHDSCVDSITSIMWCGRFVKFKHPELPIMMAAQLKKEGYRFVLDMYGNGVELCATKELAKRLGVTDVVHFCGNHPNDEILNAMRKHEIFLFTSDKQEGWGAVANESMSNGCALVGSKSIGSVPYLVDDGINGMIYSGTDVEDMTNKVRTLLDNPDKLNGIRVMAVKTMQEVWSPENAANSFISLAMSALDGNITPLENGPCSIS